MSYPKRLIEVDLPIARISAHARREKSIRHGHISTLHIWWARRPLAACRAVICAALWPDPADALCPRVFRAAAVDALTAFAKRVNPERISHEKRQLQETLSEESRARWEALSAGKSTLNPDESTDMIALRMALLDFIADFANWDNSTAPAYLETSRALTQAAHEALGGDTGTRPLVVDPFAGGGSIPLEALRVGADAFASDLNPIPVLLNKVVLEYIPKYGARLAEEVRKWGEWIKAEAEKELAEFYPKDPDGATPIAYLWARTIRCEGPSCGAEVPLIRSLWLAKKGSRTVALQLVPNAEKQRVDFRIIVRQAVGWVDQSNSDIKVSSPKFEGTVKRGAATCPCCGYTTPVSRVREQFKPRRGGASDARLFCVISTREDQQGRFYRVPTEADHEAIRTANMEILRRLNSSELIGSKGLSLAPDEPLPPPGGLGFRVQPYGMTVWSDLFSPRQLLAMTSIARLVCKVGAKMREEGNDKQLSDAVQACLSCAIGRQADHSNSLCSWNASGPKVQHLFGRQAVPMFWDFAEAAPCGDSVGDWGHAVECVLIALDNSNFGGEVGHVEQTSATLHPLPDDTVSVFFTDPPYYDAVPYSDLSDFFYVWLKRTLPDSLLPSFQDVLTPKRDECIVDKVNGKDHAFFESNMTKAMAEGRRVVRPDGIGLLVFAHKSTSGWEAQLKGMVDAGWTVTGSWPIDTEMGTRLRAMDSAALASSVHLVCRPREDANGTVTKSVGEWRDVIGELPKRIHEWMPRLAAEGVVGADAIFACLGPALEIFSRYSHVEKANGETATLREYLEHVWGAVSTEALSLIFKDANAAGLEPDARLSAMWLWTIGGAAKNGNSGKTADSEADDLEDSIDDEEEISSGSKGKAKNGFVLEYDAARKIAQGLGVHLEQCESLVEVKGDKARLRPVAERTTYLFGNGTQASTSGTGRRKRLQQQTLFAELDEVEAAEAGWIDLKGPPPGTTVLDRVHQAMILFAGNRGELLKRFLVEDGVGKDDRFWKLADNLNKLYPAGTEERRWVEGVLARKKGLGL
jgi:putative DNA methylase